MDIIIHMVVLKVDNVHLGVLIQRVPLNKLPEEDNLLTQTLHMLINSTKLLKVHSRSTNPQYYILKAVAQPATTAI